MANSFNKEEKVAFDQLLQGFQDGLVLSKLISHYKTDSTMMARTNDIVWRPQPYIMPSFSGSDQTANFKENTQLCVPSTLGFRKSVPWQMSDLDLRDALQENRLGDAAKQRLASDVNVALTNLISNTGTLFVKRSSTAVGFDDIALVDAILNEQGIGMEDRSLLLSTRDYNSMASELQKNTRSFGNDISDPALRKAFVGEVAGIATYKTDYANRKTAAAGGGSLTISTLSSGVNVYAPKATSTASASGETSNVDNRFQRVTISSTTSVAAGDAFTIAGVNAAHHITKGDTGQLKTFRVISVDSSTTMTISPPMITAQGATAAEVAYQNCIVNTASATSAIVFLNTFVNYINPFWCKGAIEILPGKIATPTDAGVAVIRGSTDQGIELVMQKFADINTGTVKFRVDLLFGLVNLQPEMTGLMMFSQI